MVLTRGAIAYPSPKAGAGAGHISMDPEGLSYLPDGGFYVSDEYAAAAYLFDKAGRQAGAIPAVAALLPRTDGKLDFNAEKTPQAGRRCAPRSFTSSRAWMSAAGRRWGGEGAGRNSSSCGDDGSTAATAGRTMPCWERERVVAPAPTVIATAKLPATTHLALRLTADEKLVTFAYTPKPDAPDTWQNFPAPTADIVPVTVQSAGGGLHFTGAVIGPHARIER